MAGAAPHLSWPDLEWSVPPAARGGEHGQHQHQHQHQRRRCPLPLAPIRVAIVVAIAGDRMAAVALVTLVALATVAVVGAAAVALVTVAGDADGEAADVVAGVIACAAAGGADGDAAGGGGCGDVSAVAVGLAVVTLPSVAATICTSKQESLQQLCSKRSPFASRRIQDIPGLVRRGRPDRESPELRAIGQP